LRILATNQTNFMKRYVMYVNPVSGETIPATDEQLENQKSQLFWIAGIEALWPPNLWVGEYHGELIFYPSKFENEDGGGNLNIVIRNTVLTEISNIQPHRYQIRYRHGGQVQERETDRLYSEFQSLSQLP
jgi:hypothetical protein